MSRQYGDNTVNADKAYNEVHNTQKQDRIRISFITRLVSIIVISIGVLVLIFSLFGIKSAKNTVIDIQKQFTVKQTELAKIKEANKKPKIEKVDANVIKDYMDMGKQVCDLQNKLSQYTYLNMGKKNVELSEEHINILNTYRSFISVDDESDFSMYSWLNNMINSTTAVSKKEATCPYVWVYDVNYSSEDNNSPRVAWACYDNKNDPNHEQILTIVSANYDKSQSKFTNFVMSVPSLFIEKKES